MENRLELRDRIKLLSIIAVNLFTTKKKQDERTLQNKQFKQKITTA